MVVCQKPRVRSFAVREITLVRNTGLKRFEMGAPITDAVDDPAVIQDYFPSVVGRCPPLRVTFLSSNAKAPQRASAGAAGYDLFAAEAMTIATGTRQVVKTDISIAVPPGHYARIAPRSGLSFKFGIDVGAGVVDSDYRGPLGIVLINNGVSDFVIAQGDRIAQLLLERVDTPEVKIVDQLDITARGERGFGSTGKNALAGHDRTHV